jgi:hypothetical protein
MTSKRMTSVAGATETNLRTDYRHEQTTSIFIMMTFCLSINLPQVRQIKTLFYSRFLYIAHFVCLLELLAEIGKSVETRDLASQY